METRGKIEQILIKHLRYLDKIGSLDWDSDLKGYGLDSISSISILVSLEDEFNIVIPDELINENTFKSASNLYATILIVKE